MSQPKSPAYTAQEALTSLKEGNARFIASNARFQNV